MIKISVGNLGSGKTLCEVREMFIDPAKRKTYSNIKTKLKNQIEINPEMIIQKNHVGDKKKRTGETEAVYEYKLNTKFWSDIKEPINVVIDEAHSIVNSRRAMSKINIIVTDWIALLRRVIGQDSRGYGTLTLITQLPRRIDPICREMATQVLYHVMHWRKTCRKCRGVWQEHSEMPEEYYKCPLCASYNIYKHSWVCEVWKFQSMKHFDMWKEFSQNTFYSHYYVKDLEKYFKLYNTFQIGNLFESFY